MLFSRKPGKALAATVKTDVVSTEVEVSKGCKIFSKSIMGAMTVMPLALPALLNFDLFYTQMTFFNDSFFSVAVPFVGCTLMGVALSQGYLQDTREDHIIAKLGDGAISKTGIREAVKSAKKDRTLVSSFSIREAIEENVNSWREAPLNSLPVENATHTVNHYLIKDGNKFRLEQEVIANDESIWDLSANALVEVYGVQEKTKMKELTHE